MFDTSFERSHAPNTKAQSTTEETLEPCGVCKFHWNKIVMPGEKHNRNCPHYHDADKGCACQGCGQRYKVDVQLPDDLWNRIKPEAKPNGAGLLCGRCIFSRIEALDEFDALSFSRLSPASTAPVVEKEWAKLLAKAISTAEPTLMPERDNLTHYVISSEAFATLAQVHRAIAKRLWGTAATAAPVGQSGILTQAISFLQPPR